MAGRLQIIHDGAHPGAVNMQRDGELLERHRPGDDPVLRIYRWQPPAVTYGYNQDPAEFDQEAVAAAGFGLVRRPTGGRAILHADELTYCVVGTSPGPLFGDSLHRCYMKINEALLHFLRGLGLEAEISAGESREEQRGALCFKSAGQHEIRVAGRKLVGSAQRRTGGVFLQHGSILAGPTHTRLTEFVLPRPDRQAVPPEVLARVTTDLAQLKGRSLSGAELDNMGRDLADSFGVVLGLEPALISYE
jgi:lipoate-protein ligase A